MVRNIFLEMYQDILVLLLVSYVVVTLIWLDSVGVDIYDKIQFGFADVRLIDENGENLEGKVLYFLDDDYWIPRSEHELETIYVKNTGALPLKIHINVEADEDSKLLDVIEWSINGEDVNGEFILEDVNRLEPVIVKAKMKNKAGNEYSNLVLSGIKIKVVSVSI